MRTLMTAWIGPSKDVPFNSTYSPLECDVCGNSIRILLPCSITSLAMVARAFEDAHAECVLNKKENNDGT
jgi:hypothetical protein